MTITPIDVALFLGRDLTNAETERAVALIPFAVGQLEAKFRGLAVLEGSETATVIRPGNGELWTPRYPVTAIDSLTVNGVAVTGFEFDQWGHITFPCGVLNAWEINPPLLHTGTAAVTYDFAIATTPPILVQAVATMVADVIRRQAANPDGVLSRQEMLGAYQISETFGEADLQRAAAGMTVPDIDGLDYWDRRRRLTSVSLTAR